MQKWLLVAISIFVVLGSIMYVPSRWWRLPFIPENWRAHFELNANILPASDDARSQFVAINPGFRAEFGDKDNPASAFLRFERTKEVSTVSADSSSGDRDINANLLDTLTTLSTQTDYQPGIQWQLFSASIDESQLGTSTTLNVDEELLKITKEVLGEQLEATSETDLQVIKIAQETITTQTTVSRFQGYDQVDNQAVADDVDLHYVVDPGHGIAQTISIGDRPNFDTACLKLLSLTGSDVTCNLPNNKFSFLLQLDDGLEIKHTPLAVDQSQQGTYYVVDRDGRYLLRLGNPLATDAAGQTMIADFQLRPGEIDGSTIDGYYIATITVNLGWLVDSHRQFPVNIKSGFFIDKPEFFISTN